MLIYKKSIMHSNVNSLLIMNVINGDSNKGVI